MDALGVGASLPRKEDERHLHGKGRFVGDIFMPNMLEVAFVRSSFAHGVIKSIEIPEAYRDQVFLASDFPNLKPIIAVPKVEGFKYSEHPALATDRVRFAGEPIAIVVARTRAEAEDIADAVYVDIEMLPAVVDVLDATAPGSPLIREDWGDNVYIEKTQSYGNLETA